MLIPHIPVARHTAERISSQSAILLLQSLFQFVRPESDSTRATPQTRLQLPNSQTQEHEGRACYNIIFPVHLNPFFIFLTADLIGLRLMSRACYNPQSALG